MEILKLSAVMLSALGLGLLFLIAMGLLIVSHANNDKLTPEEKVLNARVTRDAERIRMLGKVRQGLAKYSEYQELENLNNSLTVLENGLLEEGKDPYATPPTPSGKLARR